MVYIVKDEIEKRCERSCRIRCWLNVKVAGKGESRVTEGSILGDWKDGSYHGLR